MANTRPFVAGWTAAMDTMRSALSDAGLAAAAAWLDRLPTPPAEGTFGAGWAAGVATARSELTRGGLPDAAARAEQAAVVVEEMRRAGEPWRQDS